MWELDCEEGWVPKNWCFRTVALEKTLESPLDCKEIQPVHPKGYQCWIFIGRTDVEAETPILWPPDVKSWLIGKNPDAGRDWGQEEKGTTEDEMAGWHHWLDGQVWVNSGSWWWTGRPGVLRFMGSQRVRHDWATELNWWILREHSHLVYCFVQLFSCVWLFATPWTVARQASLSFTVSQTLLKFISTESDMPSNHLILCCPFLLLPSVFPSLRV